MIWGEEVDKGVMERMVNMRKVRTIAQMGMTLCIGQHEGADSQVHHHFVECSILIYSYVPGF